ncbi:hypothetical protein HDV03_001554 [Kappamyces sp. JEL0829]|nr:hypothetical protein HDV03_001554 [Kappamyces sp. JEL0829]KAJ3373490.1 hypothetical protein HDU91_006891 [Kappamyces sp. JEL0680]
MKFLVSLLAAHSVLCVPAISSCAASETKKVKVHVPKGAELLTNQTVIDSLPNAPSDDYGVTIDAQKTTPVAIAFCLYDTDGGKVLAYRQGASYCTFSIDGNPMENTVALNTADTQPGRHINAGLHCVAHGLRLTVA